MTEPARRVTLSASAQVKVPQDALTLTLQVTYQGVEASTVQSRLKSALDSAMQMLQKDIAPGLMEVRSGQFGLSPRYDRDGLVTTWQGRAEWILEGSDVTRITSAAGRVQSMQISQLGFRVSPLRFQQAQADAQERAIALFRQRASEIAKGFGASGYVLDDVHIGFDDGSTQPRAPMMLARAVSDSAAIPVEAGTTSVSVSVSGSVKLQ